jgi:hypothetical protein
VTRGEFLHTGRAVLGVVGGALLLLLLVVVVALTAGRVFGRRWRRKGGPDGGGL